MLPLIIDNFAGGGGASTGIERAIGRPVDLAINHSRHAIIIHRLNHPETVHLCEDLWDVDPKKAISGHYIGNGQQDLFAETAGCASRLRLGLPVGLAWFSPDCTHFSKAKGGKPRKKRIRGLAWTVTRWAKEVQPRIICLENVEEFKEWGPLTKENKPCPLRKGKTFARWRRKLESLGYEVEAKTLKACDYGAPTSRKRLFLVARRDGQPITWPNPTHGPGRSYPHRAAAECIDWSLPCPSIFERTKPLAEATLKRIAMGIKRYVLDSGDPFIIGYHAPKHDNDFRGQPLTEPLRTQTAENRFALVAPFLAKHYGGVIGQPMGKPIGTVTTIDHHSLVTAFLSKFYGTNIGSDMREPMPTVTGGGQHIAEVRAFLVKYYGCSLAQPVNAPLDTVTTKDRFGLVTVAGQDYQIVDIGLRMLTPRELARAQGFPEDYILTGTKSQQIAMIGNSVCPPIAEALVRANYTEQGREEATA